MIQPLRDFILVEKPVEKEEKVGLIYKPATAETKVVQAKVLAVGSGRVALDGTIVPLEVKVGDTVVFNKNYATEVSDGTLLLREEQLYAIVR